MITKEEINKWMELTNNLIEEGILMFELDFARIKKENPALLLEIETLEMHRVEVVQRGEVISFVMDYGAKE